MTPGYSRIDAQVPTMVNDRLRAKPPTTDVDRWRSGTVEAVDRREEGVVVTVAADGETVEVRVTEAIYDLFSGRIEAADPVGETVWFKSGAPTGHSH